MEMTGVLRSPRMPFGMPERRKKDPASKHNKKTNGSVFEYGILEVLLVVAVTMVVAQVLSMFVFATETSGGPTTYQYLADEIFGDQYGPASPEAQVFLSKAKIILKWVLPGVNVIAVTLIVITFAATIAYLSIPPFWDDVHYLKTLRKKVLGQKGKLVKSVAEMWSESSGPLNFIKMTIVPDIRSMAFYDALEIGPDGRPSMATFFKHSVPKKMMIVALLMMMNDKTLLQFLTAGADGVAFLGRKAANTDYAWMLKNLMESGKDYDPGYSSTNSSQSTKNKLVIFNAIYSGIKKYNGMNPDKRTTEYLNAMGFQVQNWLEKEIATKVNLDRPKMNVKVAVQPNDSANFANNATISKPVASLTPGAESGYVSVTITFGEGERGVVFHDTTDGDAWSEASGESATSISVDLDRVSTMPSIKEKVASVSLTATVVYLEKGSTNVSGNDNAVKKEVSAPAKVALSGRKATITAPGNQPILSITAVFTARDKAGTRMISNENIYWKNPEANKIMQEIGAANQTPSGNETADPAN